MENSELLESIINSCEYIMGENIDGLNTITITTNPDYFVICEVSNEKQVQAIARAIQKDLEAINIPIARVEGFNEGRWILVDTNDVICHIFHSEERGYYNLERLWGDAQEVNLSSLN